MRKPYFWKARKGWYVRTEGCKSQQFLAKDKATAHRLWAEMVTVEKPELPTATVASLAEAFLQWIETRISAKTFHAYSTFLASFCNEAGSTRIRDLKPFHVTRWLESHPEWASPDSQRAAISAVKRSFNWALGEGLIDRNPLAAVKKPKGRRREVLIDDAAHAAMMQAEDRGRKPGGRLAKLGRSPVRRDACFRLVLAALRHSGVRPGTIATVRIEDVSADGATWTVQEHKTRGKTGQPLIVYLSPCLQTITRLAAGGRTAGPLFVNSRGRPWTANSINLRMQKLRAKCGLPAGVVAYAYRHTYATNALVNGTDLATVAELLGHRDLKMLAQHYGHVGQAKEHLKAAAAKAMRRA